MKLALNARPATPLFDTPRYPVLLSSELSSTRPSFAAARRASSAVGSSGRFRSACLSTGADGFRAFDRFLSHQPRPKSAAASVSICSRPSSLYRTKYGADSSGS